MEGFYFGVWESSSNDPIPKTIQEIIKAVLTSEDVPAEHRDHFRKLSEHPREVELTLYEDGRCTVEDFEHDPVDFNVDPAFRKRLHELV
jgi:hypothetical protein